MGDLRVGWKVEELRKKIMDTDNSVVIAQDRGHGVGGGINGDGQKLD